jgi:hypothetical protein
MMIHAYGASARAKLTGISCGVACIKGWLHLISDGPICWYNEAAAGTNVNLV